MILAADGGLPVEFWAELWAWSAIVGIAASTLLTRASFLVLPARVRLPPGVQRALAYAPACALAAIVVPDLVLRGGAVAVDAANHRLLAALAAAAFYVPTRSLVGTIAVGMGVYTALRLAG